MSTSPPLEPPSIRPGEVPFDRDPAQADDARLAFIGRVHSVHLSRSDCPKNMREARERGGRAYLEIARTYRPALAGLEFGQGVHLLTWLDAARRDLAIQTPRHAGEPRGTFTLRSPVRPNPIGLHLVRISAIDIETGLVAIDAIDVLDGTPVLDIKPYFESVDVLPSPPRPSLPDEAG